MTVVTQHPPGTFCWFELGTTDDAAARRFYGRLFGWGAQEVPMGPEATYTLFQIEGDDVGAAYRLMPEQLKQNVPPHWTPYVSVADVDAACAKAKALGGSVVNGPMDVNDIGRAAAVRDPSGGAFSLWQAREHIGVTRTAEPNTQCWSELSTRDVPGAERFYTGLFGWTAKSSAMGPMTYTQFMNAGQPTAGMMPMHPNAGARPPYWLIYFAVADVDARTELARSLGAKVVVEPTDIPTVGRFAMLLDPQGAEFAIITIAS